MSKEYGYIGKEVTQAFRDNKGIFTPQDIIELDQENKWTNFGQLELIETKTISSVSSAIFTDIKQSTYNVHFLTLNNITFSDDSKAVRFRFFENGVEETASVYQEAYQQMFTSAFSESRNTALDYIDATFNTGNATNESANAYHYLYNLGDSTKYSFTSGVINIINDSGIFAAFFGSGLLPQASTVDQIKLFCQSGTFSGTASLYGIRSF